MKHAIRASVACAALLVTGHATAQSAFSEGQWYVSPMGTYIYKEDSDRATNSSVGAHIGLGRGFSDAWAVELNLIGNSSDAYDEVNQWGIGVDLIHGLKPWGKWVPYYSVGVGLLKTQIAEDPSISVISSRRMDDENPYAGVGAGFMRNFGSSQTKLRGEVRYRMDMADPNSYRDWLLNVGVVMPFGEPPAPPVTDADGDGVNDLSDQCPNTPAGSPVDGRGCELDSDGDGVANSKDACPDTRAGTRVDGKGCEIDSDTDGDGVVNSKDRCPNTARNTKVDVYGCKTIGDSDGDGVLDNRDRCPSTAKGARVDVNGCEFKEEIRLPGVTFETNSATLTSQSLSVLNDAAETLKRNSDVRVESQGHTDSQGAAAYNLSLSQRRAEAVRDYLVTRGAAAGNITAKGYGETAPIAGNDSAAGRAQNRRVVLKVIGQ
ncbi:MAG: OmpA family protein [Gammaproteobacteria bacterium]